MTESPDHSSDDVPDRFRVDFTGLTLNGVYRVEKKIADGGMGSIYLAEDTNLGRAVVVKVPHPRFLGEPGFRSRFSREVEELIRLEHPHVARILARGEQDDVPFFVLQFLGGGSLEDRIVAAGGRPMDPEDVGDWLMDVAATLDFVHGQGLVHRDVKPANILFDEAGHVFLSDFGVAKVVDSDDAITGSGVGIGSPKYMAPEQGIGRDVGPASDQYALGAVVYEALAGSPPIDGDTPIEILVKKGKEAPTPLSGRVPDLPPGAADAVMRALATDPGERFDSCREFSEVFRAGLHEARSGTSDETPAEGRKRHPIWPYLLSGTVVLLGLLLNYLEGRRDEEDPEPGSVIRLLSEGSLPRQALRLAPEPGLVQRLRTDLRFTMKLTAQGMDPVEIGPVGGGADSEFRVDGAESPFPFAWVIVATESPGLEGSRARGKITDRGRMLSFGVSGDPGTEVPLSQLSATVRQLPVPLPRKPVGVGARWEVTETVHFLGMRVVQTSTYELTALKDGRATIHMAAAQTAVPGERLSLGLGADLLVSTVLARGEGDVEIDLGMILPVRSSIVIDMDITGRVEGKEEEGDRRLEFRVESSAGPIEEKE